MENQRRKEKTFFFPASGPELRAETLAPLSARSPVSERDTQVTNAGDITKPPHENVLQDHLFYL